MIIRYFYIGIIGLFMPIMQVQGMMQLRELPQLPGLEEQSDSEDSSAYPEDSNSFLNAEIRSTEKRLAGLRALTLRGTQSGKSSLKPKKTIKPMIAMPDDAAEKLKALRRAIDDLKKDIPSVVDDFIKNDRLHLQLLSHTNTNFFTHKIDFFEQTLARLENLKGRACEYGKFSQLRKSVDEVHDSVFIEILRLQELSKITATTRRAFTELYTINALTPSEAVLERLKKIEVEVGQKLNGGIVHGLRNDPTVQQYQAHNLAILRLFLSDVESNIEREFKKRETELQARRQKEKEEYMAKRIKAGVERMIASDAAQNKRSFWKIAAAGVATVATVALLVKGYFWLRGRTSAA